MEHPLDQHYWDLRYEQEQTGWDLGEVSPPLKNYFDQLTDKSQRILIPGGGNSYEARYLMERGFEDVTVIDISGVVIEKLSERFSDWTGAGLRLIHQDFFKHEGQYDLIVEQTFFCALDSTLRPDYAAQMQRLLSPAGKLVGVLFDRAFPDGPPFGGSRAEYRALLEKYLEVLSLEPCHNSVAPRAGSEAFLIARKAAHPPTA